MISHLILFVLVSLAWNPSVIAQDTRLNEAELYDLLNDVRIQKRPAKRKDPLIPKEVLETGNAPSLAELLFNEGSIARVAENATFRFTQGLRRFQLPTGITMTETVFRLEDGKALVIAPPNSVATQIETPDTRINIRAIREASKTSAAPYNSAFLQLAAAPSLDLSTLGLLHIAQTPAPTSELLEPPQKSAAVMVTYDDAKKITQVFALTDSEITYADLTGQSRSLQGGQMVTAVAGQAGQPQEFDLEAFCINEPLAAGLGPGHEGIILEEPAGVQATLTVVREATLEAIENQKARRSKLSFLSEALTGLDSGFSDIDEFRADSPPIGLINPQVTNGTFTRTGETTGTFTPDSGGPDVLIEVNADTGTLSFDNRPPGIPQVGRSGNNVSGTLIFPDGSATRFEVIDVGGRLPPIDDSRSGTLTDGIAPDR